MSRAELPALLGLRIQGEKIVGYLLDPTHPRGGSKARFLLRFGFSATQPNVFADALVQHYLTAPDTHVMSDTVGSERIICEGPITGSDGREPWIRSVWLVGADLHGRRLTIVPLPGRGSTTP